MERKDQAAAYEKLRKVDDKYILQKFNREFDQVAEYICNEDEDELNSLNDNKQDRSRINYLRFKEFLVEMCLLTEQQASIDCHESQLAFDLWEVIAPKVEREMNESVDDGGAQMEQEYREEVKAKFITLFDLRTILMAILRYNDGKRFVDAIDAPMPQSEGEIGFRKPDLPNGKFMVRYEELG